MSKKVFVDEYVEVWKRYTFEIPDEMDPEQVLNKLSETDGEPLEIEDADKGIEFIEAYYMDETEIHSPDSRMEVYVPENIGYKFIGDTK